MIRTLATVAAFAGLLAAFGCSPKDDGPRVVATGKLLDNGKPYIYEAPKGKGGAAIPPPSAGSSGTGLQIQFTPVEGGDTYYAAFNGESSTFEVKGNDGKGIKPGKYKVFLTVVGGPPGTPEIFNGKFARDKSKIERDIAVDGPEIVIDISKPAG